MLIRSGNSHIIVSTKIRDAIEETLFRNGCDKIFILMDENSEKHCFPLLADIKQFADAEKIIIESGEKNKSVRSLEKIWSQLSNNGATRSSLMINIGGGVICDMGGFAASTFKRGISFMNVPTTLLSQVDASMGGKTGVNFQKLKNEIGVFSNPEFVFIDSTFLKTLENRHILAGWAEMMKHALIFSEEDWNDLIKERVQSLNYQRLNQLITKSVNIKKHFVEQDPNEQGIRKALNVGHTVGHAFESFYMNREDSLLHGEAVAHGIVVEMFLSHKKMGFPLEKAKAIAKYIIELYGKLELLPINDERFMELMSHDKKNRSAKINFTLLSDFGKPVIDQELEQSELKEIFEIYRQL